MASELHVHSTFSKLDAYGLPEQMIIRALELGLHALAITDHGNTSAHPKLEMAATKYGKCKSCGKIMDMKDKDHLCADPEWHTVKPLYGVELYLNTKRQRKNHITLIAKDIEGYKNLVALASLAYTEDHFYYLPCVDLEDVIAYQKGIIVLSGCMSGAASELINKGKLDEAEQLLLHLSQNIEHFYVEVQPLDIAYTMEDDDKLEVEVTAEKLARSLIDIAARQSLQVVATNDSHFVRKEDKWLQHFLAMVRRKKNVKNFPDSMSERCCLAGEMAFKDWMKPYGTKASKQAIANQDKIADICDNFELPKAAPMKWNDKPDEERYQELVAWCNEGWDYRKCKGSNYRQQGQYELGLIKEKGFYDYFLIVADMVKWAKAHNIMVGPARGSAGASLVSYMTRITEVDPIRFKLLFERFLDPSRSDPPDIDLDFQDDRREEVKDYMKSKWGDDKVKNVAGYTMYHEKGLLDDIGRCYCIPPNNIEQYKKKLTSEGGNKTFEEVLRLMEDTCTPRIPKNMERMLGQLRGFTKHAAGLVVSSESLSTLTTIMGDQIAVDKRDAEYLNLLKIDVLSLTTLRVLALALHKVGMSVEELYSLPLDIRQVYEGFKNGDMQGIFQYTGSTTRNVCIKALHDIDMETADLAAVFDVVTDVNTLSRPASMNNGSTARYIANDVEDIHPWITKHTQNTRGQIIYQEQIMRVLREGGLDWSDVTAVRKLMTKHEGKEKLDGIKRRFFKYLMEYGTKPEMCDVVWSRIGDEGAYGFNVAHCVAYTLIAYYTMWLKVFHPLVFYWANMMVAPEDNDMLREFAQSGGHIYEVRFGLSDVHWSIDKSRNGLRAGYTTIKGIGEKTANKICELQESHRVKVAYSVCPHCQNENNNMECYIDEFQGNSVFRCEECSKEYAEFECGEYIIKDDVVVDISDFSNKVFSSLSSAGVFDDDAELHDYLGFSDLTLKALQVPGRMKLKDVMDGDMSTVVVKLSDWKVKNLRDYYKKNGKDYNDNEVQQGHLDTYVNMKIYDEDGEMQLTLSRYKYPQYKEIIEEFDKDKVYEILIDYKASKSKGYIMNIMEAGERLVIPDDEGIVIL